MSDFKEIANEDMSLNYVPKSAATPSQDPTKIEVKSQKVFHIVNNQDKAIEVQILTLIQPGNCTYVGHTHVNGIAIMQPTAEKCTDNNQKPFRKDDEATCRGIFTNNANGATVSCECDVCILYAGQSNDLCK